MAFYLEKECYIVTFYRYGYENIVSYVKADSENDALEEAIRHEKEVFIGQRIFTGTSCHKNDLILYEMILRSCSCDVKYNGPDNLCIEIIYSCMSK
ncbi:hypothetical protein QJ854_gp885 [Moumouvirus goulette]|uniref:Uncharacterized protein n=1 Tax=Moumouvirus goulette TaxID=1247379 RepID=M1PVZ9_9VIRU|nr:hypothetical protein QJ854_gp885 [Moumouvirus goulette]AGF84897.1 hypothetical protein glt_00088 [Moumouvirus goulette]